MNVTCNLKFSYIYQVCHFQDTKSFFIHMCKCFYDLLPNHISSCSGSFYNAM